MLTRSERRAAVYRLLVDSVATGAATVFDRDLRILAAGGPALATAHPDGHRLEGRTAWEVLPGPLVEVVVPRYVAALGGRRQSFDATDGTRTFAVTAGPVPGTQELGAPAAVATWHDVTTARADRAALARDEELFRTAFADAPVGVAILGMDGRYRAVNRAMCEIIGHPAEDLLERPFAELTHPDDVAAARVAVRRLLSGDVGSAQVEQRYLDPTGAHVWTLVSASLARDEGGRPLHVVAHVLDIGERRQREQHLRWQAERDGLTGLWNRRRFEEELDRRRNLAERHGEVTAVILLDLDDFKSVNDSYGHVAGDEVLRRVADVLASGLRTPDLACRFGGDEFAVVLPHTRRTEAAHLAERLVESLSRQVVEHGGHRIAVSATVGVGDNAEARDPVAAADQALYVAKRARGAS